MGIKLINEIMDHAPRMTATEWKAMIILAEDANDGTRQTWSIVTGEKIMRRMDLSPAAATNLRSVLVRKGLLEVSVAGRRGRAAKYRFPEFREMAHESHEESVPMGHESHEETTDPDVADDVTGHEIHEETDPIGHESDEATAEWVMGSVTPTPQELPSEQNTPQNLSLAQLPQWPSPAAVPTTEREINGTEPEPQPEEPQARPQEQRPAKDEPQPSKFDAKSVASAWVQGRADAGQPATAAERGHILVQAAELLTLAEPVDYLVRLARWMAREHPTWKDLAYARGAFNASASIPTQRSGVQDDRCASGACRDCAHPVCDVKGWIDSDDGDLVRCPCYTGPTAASRPKPGDHQTYRDPDNSVYYDPKAKPYVGFQNPTDPDAYEGTF